MVAITATIRTVLYLCQKLYENYIALYKICSDLLAVEGYLNNRPALTVFFTIGRTVSYNNCKGVYS